MAWIWSDKLYVIYMIIITDIRNTVFKLIPGWDGIKTTQFCFLQACVKHYVNLEMVIMITITWDHVIDYYRLRLPYASHIYTSENSDSYVCFNHLINQDLSTEILKMRKSGDRLLELNPLHVQD